MITSFSDLLPLTPLLLATATAVIAMLLIGIRRNYLWTAAVVIIGLIATAVVAAQMMFDTNQQVTPLLIVDQYSMFFVFVCSIAAVFIAILSFPYFYSLDDHKEEYYLMLSVAVIGAIVMVSSNHFISAILGLETLSMSLYGMVAYPLHSKESAKYPLEASVKYLVLSAVATGFILFGMSLVYAQTGSLAFTDLSSAEAQQNSLGEAYTVVALLMIAAGMAFKLSLAPFHVWTPDVYEGSPLPATSFLATVGKVAMFVVLLRFISITNALQYDTLITIFSLIAGASILAGNLLALLQDNIKRILAYSSIAHMGYLLIAIIAAPYEQGALSVESITYYLVAYAIMTLGAFAIVSIISCSEKEYDSITDYTGLFWRNPWLSSSFIAMLLSLSGIPLTVGFIAKFYIFMSGVESGLWSLLIVLVIGSGIGLYYYLRIVYRMLVPIGEDKNYRIAGLESISSYGVIAILVFLLLLFGVYPAPLMSLIGTVSAAI
jgi:NADH-quinone oxidoreductase subunit N